MQILQISYSDCGGGAERVALDLARGYEANGHKCAIAVGHKRTDLPQVVKIPGGETFGLWGRFWAGMAKPLARCEGRVRGAAWARWLLINRIAQPRKTCAWLRGYEDFESPGSHQLLPLVGRPVDLVHGHNLHRDYFDLHSLPALSQQVPVVLTLHDAWLLTGHCAHPFDCERWLTGCGACPYLGTYPSVRRDATTFNWRVKQDILARSHAHLVTPSRWLMDMAARSPITSHLTGRTVIPNGVDLSIFKPGDQAAARRRLGLPVEGRMVLFAHPGAKTSQFKDYATFAKCARRLGQERWQRPLKFLAVGPALPAEEAGGIKIEFAPLVTDREVMADYYRAADIYLHPARAENFPLAVLEAMACGLPVVASRVGGIPEQIVDGQNGYLREVGDAAGMATAIKELLTQDGLAARIGAAAMARAVQDYGLDKMTGAYLALFEQLLKQRAMVARQ